MDVISGITSFRNSVNRDGLLQRPILAEDSAIPASRPSKNIAEGILMDLVRRRSMREIRRIRNKRDRFWRQVGYEVAGPLYYGFANWIFHQCRDLGINRIYFLARDGQNLCEVFKTLSEKWGERRLIYYMYASRRLLNFARIKETDRRAEDFLVEPAPGMRVRHFFERIGLGYKTVKVHWKLLNGRLWNQLIASDTYGRFLNEEYKQLVSAMVYALKDEILASAENERALLLAYFGSIGFPSDKAGVVNIGWSANTVQSLDDLVGREGMRSKLIGLYFGTWKSAKCVIESGIPIESWYVEQELPEPRRINIDGCIEYLETLFVASHPTIIGIRRNGGSFRPVFGKQDFGAWDLRALEVLRDAAMQFVEDFSGVYPRALESDDFLGYLDVVLNRIICHPTHEEARIVGRIPHRRGFGDGSPLCYLARPPHRLVRLMFPARNTELYRRSCWSKGYLAQLTPVEVQDLLHSVEF